MTLLVTLIFIWQYQVFQKLKFLIIYTVEQTTNVSNGLYAFKSDIALLYKYTKIRRVPLCFVDPLLCVSSWRTCVNYTIVNGIT